MKTYELPENLDILFTKKGNIEKAIELMPNFEDMTVDDYTEVLRILLKILNANSKL